MAGKRATRPRLDALAARQHGVVSIGQLYELGLSDDRVRVRVGAGWLHPVHRGVYAVGRSEIGVHGAWMAAVLACGSGSVLSHGAAGALWRIIPGPELPGAAWRSDSSAQVTRMRVDVTARTAGGRRTRPGLTVHRCPTLDPSETTAHQGIPVTVVERTILDLATVLSHRGLERAVDEAHRLRLTDLAQIREIMNRHPGRRGTGGLRRLLKEHAIGSTVTRSELEERMLALCRARDLPPPQVNAPLHGFTVDFLWRSALLVVEVDGHQSHRTRAAFQADRDRDGTLAALGFATLRFTWWDVTRRPAVVAHRIRRLLERRG